jgi:hypothetical protein
VEAACFEVRPTRTLSTAITVEACC